MNKFNNIFKTIKTYIEYTLNSNVRINEYVTNYHIAEIFKNVLQACEKENLYPEIYHNLQYDGNNDDVYSISFLDKIDDYFNIDLLNENGIHEIHRVYQKLRETNDYIRQSLILIDIKIPYEYNMKHKLLKNLKSDKIKIL